MGVRVRLQLSSPASSKAGDAPAVGVKVVAKRVDGLLKPRVFQYTEPARAQVPSGCRGALLGVEGR